jgi:hypothetical protein
VRWFFAATDLETRNGTPCEAPPDFRKPAFADWISRPNIRGVNLAARRLQSGFRDARHFGLG